MTDLLLVLLLVAVVALVIVLARRTAADPLSRLTGVIEGQQQQLAAMRAETQRQLEQVHRGLGEMQSLAAGVGDLKRVLSNVKVRGTWGEVQLGSLLEQILSPGQYAANVRTRSDGRERVEFAVRLPGRGDDPADVVWLPIDAKFPMEDYLRLQDCQDAGDAAGAELCGRDLENRVKVCARDIATKYLEPPRTTDFALMFLPTEGLYAEVVRRALLVEQVQRDHRVLLAGPTTLAALLNSLQMGFRTLAIERRTSEVWDVLAGAKSEVGKYADQLERVRRKLQEASGVVEDALRQSRRIERTLRDVQKLPSPQPPGLPPGVGELTTTDT